MALRRPRPSAEQCCCTANALTARFRRLYFPSRPLQDREKPDAIIGDLASGLTLTGFERAMAHQYCDELGLMHDSHGEEPYRGIKMTKKEVGTAARGTRGGPRVLEVGCAKG
jgi:hypothetical protein